MSNTESGRRRLSTSAVAERFGVTRRTVGRWLTDPAMEFPAPLTLNGRHYFDEVDLETYERRVVALRGRAA